MENFKMLYYLFLLKCICVISMKLCWNQNLCLNKIFCIYYDTNDLQACKTELSWVMVTNRIFENIFVYIIVYKISKITNFLLFVFVLIVIKYSLGYICFWSNSCAAEGIVYKSNKVWIYRFKFWQRNLSYSYTEMMALVTLAKYKEKKMF